MDEPYNTNETSTAGYSPAGKSKERHKVLYSAIIAGFLVLLIWLIWIFQWLTHTDLRFLALHPRTVEGLPGILFEPLLHGSFEHIASNSLPLFLLLTGTLYFYREAGYKALGWIWVLTGALVWCFGRASLHIGASGVVYGLASFLIFSGFIRRDTRLMAISLLTVFLYGSMVWGIFPIIPGISWETHLMGGLSGLYAAIRFRKLGPQAPKYFEDEEPELGEVQPAIPPQGDAVIIRYTYKPTVAPSEPEKSAD